MQRDGGSDDEALHLFFMSVSHTKWAAVPFNKAGTSSNIALACLTTDEHADRPLPIRRPKGRVMIALESRRGGIMRDQFVLTNDKAFIPANVFAPTPSAPAADAPKTKS